METNIPDRPIYHDGEINGVKYKIHLNVWPDGATIESVTIEGETRAYYSGYVFESEDAALYEAKQMALTKSGSDERRSDPVGVKSIWGVPVNP